MQSNESAMLESNLYNFCFQPLAAQSSEMIIVLDSNHRIIFLNQAAELIFDSHIKEIGESDFFSFCYRFDQKFIPSHSALDGSFFLPILKIHGLKIVWTVTPISSGEQKFFLLLGKYNVESKLKKEI